MAMPEPEKTTVVEKAEDSYGGTWFYVRHGETYGPISSRDLRATAHLGFLGPGDLVRNGEQGGWEEARHVRGLFKEAT